jgi:hypothetical protein
MAMKRGRKRNVKPRKEGLTRQHKGGPAAHKEAVARALRVEGIARRQAQAWRLFTERLTMDQIGAKLDISNAQAHRDCCAFRDKLDQYGVEDAVLLRTRQQANIDGLILAHWPKRREKASADIIRDAMAREARLNGLDRERKDAYSPDQMATVLRICLAVLRETVPDIEAQRLYAVGLRRRLGPALASAIDVSATDSEGADK